MRKRLPPVMQQHDYALLWVALLVMAFATQMTAVAVGWQVYAIHENPFDLGLIGLAEFLPLPLLALPARPVAEAMPEHGPDLGGLLAGIGFIRRTPVLLGAISLDLFAVLFGGAVALLPVFARSILHVGPAGLGVLRSAPAVGALLA